MWLNSVPRRGVDSYLPLSDAVLGCVDDGSLDVRQVKINKKKYKISDPPVFAPSFVWRPLSFSYILAISLSHAAIRL